jgi:hypothetical protein
MPIFYGCISVVVRTQVDCIRHNSRVEIKRKMHVIQERKTPNFAYFYNYDFR